MKVPLSWLRELVPVEADPAEIADRLSMAGLQVDEVRAIGGPIEGVLVGEVRAVRDHPRSDRLVLVDVDTGSGMREIVCGARNFSPGDRVPVALPGAKLRGGMEIGRREVRGVASDGMLCSPQELGVGDDHSGILVLDAQQPVGEEVRTALALDDVVFDIDVLPDRPDALSVVGVARDVAAIYGLPLTVPAPVVPESDPDVSSLAGVAIEDDRGCPRYLARAILGVRPSRSPWWMRRRLWACGMRPISNVVDVTNYVLIERGHPLHAFDLDRLDGARIVVRRPRRGERIVTLDGLERELSREDVAICDARRPVAVAGIMGGAETEVGPGTTRILLESAYFDPRRVGRTARRLGLRTEASVRFERGADPEGVPAAAARAAALIAELSGGSVARGAIDVHPRPWRPRRLSVRVARINALIGTGIPAEEIAGSLRSIGCAVPAASRASLKVEPPSFRPDLLAEEDVVEEVARLHGYDRIPATLPAIGQVGALTREQRLRRVARAALLGTGASEAQTLSLIPPKMLDRLSLPDGHPWRRALACANPLSEEESLLRPSLLPGLLLAAARNVARWNRSVALFELGRTFAPRVPANRAPAVTAGSRGDELLPEERDELAWVMTGPAPGGWHARERPYDFLDAKGALESVLRALGVDDWRVERADEEAPWHPGRVADVLVAGRPAGRVGELHPRAAEALDLPGRVAMGWLSVESLLSAAREFRPMPVPRFPPVRRDLAVVVPEGTSVAEVEQVLRRAGAPLLESADLFDVYRGERIPPGTVSLAFSLSLRDPERTLTDIEAVQALARVQAALDDAGWRIRD